MSKKTIVNDLIRINEEKIAYIETMTMEFKAEIIAAQKKLSNSLIGYIKDFKTKAGVMDSKQVLGAFNSNNLINITKFLEESGVNTAVNKLMVKEAEIIKYIKETYTAMGIPLTFTSRDLSIIKAVQDLDLFNFRNLSEATANEINRQLFGQVSGASKFSDMVENLRGLITGPAGKAGILDARAYTIANTSTFAFDRKVLTMKVSDNKEQKYVYTGALIKDSRPFCRRMVGKIFTKEEITQMSNGQGLDVFNYGGGWNCSHSWIPVLDEFTDDDFSDYRSEMKKQLKEVRST